MVPTRTRPPSLRTAVAPHTAGGGDAVHVVRETLDGYETASPSEHEASDVTLGHTRPTVKVVVKRRQPRRRGGAVLGRTAQHAKRPQPRASSPSMPSSSMPSPVICDAPVTAHGTRAQWIQQAVFYDGRVVAAVPPVAGQRSRTVALDAAFASGRGAHWLDGMAKQQRFFNEKKSMAFAKNRNFFEAISLQSRPVPFLPEGKAYGLALDSDMDAHTDAGVRVELRETPYTAACEPVQLPGSLRQQRACVSELALLAAAAERGLAPALLGAFVTRGPLDSGRCNGGADAPAGAPAGAPARAVRLLVVASELSTFSLDDMLRSYVLAHTDPERLYLSAVLHEALPLVFDQLKMLSTPHGSRGLLKLNCTPESVLFCPKLAEVPAGWKLQGIGHRPVSTDYVDGVPRLSDFHPLFCASVDDRAYFPEAAHLAHCLLLVCYSRAVHGPDASRLLWRPLLAAGDPTGFATAARAVHAQQARANVFFASCAAELCREAGVPGKGRLRPALDEFVHGMRVAAEHGIVADANADADSDAGARLLPIPNHWASVFPQLVELVLCAAPGSVSTQICDEDALPAYGGPSRDVLLEMAAAKTARGAEASLR